MIKKLLRINQFARRAKAFFQSLTQLNDTPFRSIVKVLNQLDSPVVIDVGANVGQFGLDLRRSGYRQSILSFEPLSEVFKKLEQNSARHKPWKSFNLALGREAGFLEIKVSGNSGLSSSFLDMHNTHVSSFPKSRFIKKELVKISTLDFEIEHLKLKPENILLKLDVQGYESLVLQGGAKSLPYIPHCFIEVSIKTLYEGELTLLPLMNLLKEYGHEVIDIFRGTQTRSGELLQVDILTSNYR